MIKQRILDEAWDDPIEYAMGKGIKETFNSLEEINFQKSQVCVLFFRLDQILLERTWSNL